VFREKLEAAAPAEVAKEVLKLIDTKDYRLLEKFDGYHDLAAILH